MYPQLLIHKSTGQTCSTLLEIGKVEIGLLLAKIDAMAFYDVKIKHLNYSELICEEITNLDFLKGSVITPLRCMFISHLKSAYINYIINV